MKVVQASKRKGDPNVEAPKEAGGNDSTPSASNTANDEISAAVTKLHEDDDEDGDSSDSEEKTDGGNHDLSSSSKRIPKTLFGITAGEIESISKEVRWFAFFTFSLITSFLF